MTRLRVDHFNRTHAFQPSLLVLLLVGALLAGAPAAASAAQSQVDLQSQASELSLSIATQSNQIHQLAVQESSASAALSQAQLRLYIAQRRVSSDQIQLDNSKRLLGEIALDEFTHDSGAQSLLAILSSTQGELVARIEYERVMGLDVNTAIFVYHRAQIQENQEISAALAARNAAVVAQGELQASQSSLQSVVLKETTSLASINGQVAALVQQQLAARLAAQRAAAAAQAAAISSQGAPSSAGIRLVSGGQAGVSNWGGTPAPPSPAAFAALRQCESSDNYQDNTGNGYYGAYQFSLSTWHGLGFGGLPSNAPPSEQDLAAQIEQRGGWYAWPECALVLGLI